MFVVLLKKQADGSIEIYNCPLSLTESLTS